MYIFLLSSLILLQLLTHYIAFNSLRLGWNMVLKIKGQSSLLGFFGLENSSEYLVRPP